MSCFKIIKDWFINENKEYECKICGKVFPKNGIGNHIKYHYGYKGHLNGNGGNNNPWNKGLTKETSDSLKKAAKTFKKNYDAGLITLYIKGKKHSEETKNKWKENPNMGGLRHGSGRGKKGWYKGFYCRSTWELAWLVYQKYVHF